VLPSRLDASKRIWHKSVVTIFVERFVLGVLAALFLLIITNPMHLAVLPRVVAGLVIVVVAYFCARAIHKPAVSGQVQHVSKPTGEPSLAVVAVDSSQLRQNHGVASLQETQEGKSFAEIPPNSFSFMYGHAFVMGYKSSPVHISDGSNFMFEVHKLTDKSVMIIGYVGPETRDRLLEGLKTGEALTVYSRLCTAATDLVAVPVSKLKFKRDRTLTIAKKQLWALDCEGAG
jgi:hypothetical protein